VKITCFFVLFHSFINRFTIGQYANDAKNLRALLKYIVLQSRKHHATINSTTVYIQLSGDSGTWLPVIDSHTHKPLVSLPIEVYVSFVELEK